MRSEASYFDWSSAPPSERPLKRERGKHASQLFSVLKARNISDERFADMIGVTKSVAQKYLSGEKPIPTTILDADTIPFDVRAEFLECVCGIARIDREVDRLDRDGLIRARDRIIARLDAILDAQTRPR